MSENTQPTSLQEKLEAARAAAAASAQQAAPGAGGVPAEAQQTGTAIAPTSYRSNADLVSQTFSVDKYAKVSKEGLGLFVDNNLIQEEIDVLIDFADCIPHQTIKAGSPVKYEKTYDGRMAKSGKTWAQAIEDQQKIDPKARPYDSVDVCMTTVGDIKGKDKIIAAEGTRLGYALSTTNKTEWVNFCKAAASAGVDINKGKVFARVGCKPRSGNGFTWGLMTFEFLGPYLEN